jgi:Rhs element Vgr protein
MAKLKQEGYISYKITVGSKTYKSEGPLLSLSATLEVNRIPEAIITFVDGDPNNKEFELHDDKDFSAGKKVTISLGYEGKNELIFEGILLSSSIRSLDKRGMSMQIRCSHEAVKMTISKRIRFFEKKDDKAIITELFKENGLTGKFSGKGSFIKHESFLQFDITDWDFFLNRAEFNSKIVLFDGDKVEAVDAKISGSPVHTFIFGTDIIEFESEVSAENQYKKIEAHTWDSDTQKIVSKVAKESDFKQFEGNSGVKKSELEKVVSPSSYELFHGGEMSNAEIEGWGKAQFTKGSLSKTRGRLKVLGASSFKLGDVIKLEGLGTKFSGEVMITGLVHEYNSRGWYTHIQFGLTNEWFVQQFDINKSSVLGSGAGVNGLQIGTVIKIDGDPQHRIQIALPIGGQKIKIWARMAFEDAGNNRGRIFWPEKDDEVIVGFLNNDPRNAIIIGSVYSKKNVPPIKPDAKNEVRAIVSKSDVRISINEKDKSIVVKTPGGNQITIDDKKESIIMEDQHKNTIKMEKSGVTITSKGDITLDATKKINLKAKGDVAIEGTNISSKAKAKFSADGKAGVDVTTSAIAVLKGSMVKIN